MRLPSLLFVMTATTLIGACASSDATKRCDVDEPEQRSADTVEEVRARSEAMLAYERAGDAHSVAQMFTEDGVLMLSNRPLLQGRDAIAELYDELYGRFDLSGASSKPATIEVHGDLAYERGTNRSVAKTDKASYEMVGKYVIVWKRQDADWYVAVFSSSSDSKYAEKLDDPKKSRKKK